MAKTRILIVETTAIEAWKIQERLEQLNYDVIGVSLSGKSAIQHAAKTRPDLVLLNITLTGVMNGIAAAEHIRTHCDIPVLYLTPYTHDTMLHHAGMTAPCECILKPLNTRELYTHIEMALYRHSTDKRIQTLLREKEILLRENHHRVKNNLQFILSLLNLQANSIQDAHILNLLQQNKNRITCIAIIHEMLCQSNTLSHLNAPHYITQLAQFILNLYASRSESIALELALDEVTLDIDMAICLGLIVHELLTNTMKYAFPDQDDGLVQIQLFSRHYGHFSLAVRDNGIGFPSNIDFQNTPSLGLQLVNLLTKQLRGIITLDTTSGTSFTMTFPEPKPSIHAPVDTIEYSCRQHAIMS